MPEDIHDSVAMAVLDVVGAPATVNAHCREGQIVVMVGAGGKGGMLSCFAARERMGASGKIIGIEPNATARAELLALGICDEVLALDASDPIAMFAGVEKVTRGKMGDVVVNVASSPNTEIATILCANAEATVFFFGMATSFSKAVLGAEGLATTARLVMGNGYYPGHAEYGLGLIRRHRPLKDLFYKRYSG
jgi:L-erythro-3,5-diaminohexanoate dehydrogenase